MRILAFAVIGVSLLGVAPRSQQTEPAVVAQVRQALGGAAALAQVTSFSMEGAGEHPLAYGGSSRYSVQIDCQFPDKLVVTRSQSERGRSVTERDGINGNELIRETIMSPPQPPAPVDPDMPQETPEAKAHEQAAQLVRVRQWFAALTLVLFARSLPGYPMELSDGGTRDVQDAPARLVEGRARDGSVVRLYVDPRTYLPVMVSWLGTRPQTALPGIAPAMPPAEVTGGLEAPLIEHQLCAGDYKPRMQLNWPRLLVEYVAGSQIEELKIGNYKINPRLSADRFKAVK